MPRRTPGRNEAAVHRAVTLRSSASGALFAEQKGAVPRHHDEMSAALGPAHAGERTETERGDAKIARGLELALKS